MAKAFNLLGNTDSIKNKKDNKSKSKSLIDIPIAEPTKKKGRPKKIVDNVEKVVEKTEPVIKKQHKITSTTKLSSPPKNNTNKKYHNLYTNPPELNRPIIFNTDNIKELITGYKIYNGIVVNNPYSIDSYRKINNTIEWQYISGCNDLSNCPNGFPNCNMCDIYKTRVRELKKKETME